MSRSSGLMIPIVLLLTLTTVALSPIGGTHKDNEEAKHQIDNFFAISYLNINITAKDDLLFYADGLYLGSHDDYTRSGYFNAPQNTLVYAVKVTTLGNPPVEGGLRASTSSGEVTDTSWRCTATYFQGWEQVSFDDSGWPEAIVSPNLSPSTPYDIDPTAQWISGGNANTCYCRKTRRVLYVCDDSNICLNEGTCLNFIDNKQESVRCNCLPVYYGSYCETPITKMLTSDTCGSTCMSSSDYDVDTTCTSAIDSSYKSGPGSDWVSNNEGVTAWITVNFTEFYIVTSMAIIQRCPTSSQSSLIDIQFSAGRPVPEALPCVDVPNNDNVTCDEIIFRLNITSTITNSVRVEVKEVCSSVNGLGTAVGFNEIIAYGLDAALENVAALSCNANCQASSEFDVTFSCENAMDEREDPAGSNGWLSDNEGAGAWIRVDLPVAETIVGVGLLQLCYGNSQVGDVRLEFSDGSYQEIVMDCFPETECTQQYWQHYTFPAVSTSYVLFRVLSVCDSYSGFREIRIFAYSGMVPTEGKCPVPNP